MTVNDHLLATADLLRQSASAELDGPVAAAIDTITAALAAGLPLLICGNGGSAADAAHIAGELVGRYRRDRAALNARALAVDPAVTTAWANDFDFAGGLAREVQAYGAAGGVLLGISTSGNSANVIRAFEQAHTLGMTTIALTGQGGGGLAAHADVLIAVPSADTPSIQEVHTCLYHYMCEEIERRLAT